MAFTLTAVIASICFIDACVIGHWAWDTNIIPLKDKKTSYAVVQAIAFIIAFALVVLCWYLFTHQALPQWLTGVGSRPSSGGEISQQNTVYAADGFITLLAFPFLVAALAMGVSYATKYALTNIDYKHTGRKIGDISERKKTDIFDDSVFMEPIVTVQYGCGIYVPDIKYIKPEYHPTTVYPWVGTLQLINPKILEAENDVNLNYGDIESLYQTRLWHIDQNRNHSELNAQYTGCILPLGRQPKLFGGI